MAPAVMRSVVPFIATAVLAALPLRAAADIPGPGPRPPRPDFPQPSPAPEPRSSSGLCAGKAAGTACEIPASSAGSPTVGGQCVPVTCPTPQPPGLQYSCLDCEAPIATSLESTQRDGAFVADSAAAQGDFAPTGSESTQRLWISMLLGVLALAGGVVLVYRNARRRRG